MTAIAVIIAKAQVHSDIWYGWILSAKLVVPCLLLGAAIFGLIALGGVTPIATFYWRVFAVLVPPPKAYRSESATNNKDAGNAEEASVEGVPDLSVRYAVVPGERPKLIFSTKGQYAMNIKSIGKLISEESYRCEHDLGLLQTVYQPLDASHPLECPMQIPLTDLLENGGPATLDSLCVECSDKNGTYSFVFYLYKNQDGSVVWVNTKPQQNALSLDGLREERRRLRNAVPALMDAGALKALLTEAENISYQLSEIINTNRNERIPNRNETDLSRPLSRETVFLTDTESERIPWQKTSLMRFVDRYNRLASACAQYGLSVLTPAPNDQSAKAVFDALLTQQSAMRERLRATVTKYSTRYSEAEA